jgi:hypothetical protein
MSWKLECSKFIEYNALYLDDLWEIFHEKMKKYVDVNSDEEAKYLFCLMLFVSNTNPN